MNRTKSIALAALVLLAGCPGEDEGAQKDPARPVVVEKVATSDAVKEVSVVGTLEGANEVDVVAQMAERIVSLKVGEGDKVRRGQVLAILQMDTASSQVNQARAALTAAEANRDALAQDVERTRRLVKAGAAPPQQLEALESQLHAVEAQVAQSATGVSAAGVQRRRAVITAPISGKVANLIVKKGDTVAPGRPLMTIVQGRSVKAVFQVPEREFLKVRQGMTSRLAPLGDLSQERVTSVTVTGSVVDRRTRTGLVEMHLDNPGGALIPGAAVRARIEIERRPDVVLVPAEAVMLTATTDLDGKALTFVEEGGVAKKRQVVIGVRQGSKIEVKEGLRPGERLVVRGQHLLRDGAAVKATVRGEEAPAAESPAGAGAEEAPAKAAAPPGKEGDGA